MHMTIVTGPAARKAPSSRVPAGLASSQPHTPGTALCAPPRHPTERARTPLPPRPPGIPSGSGKPNETKVGQVTRAQVEEIAKKKLPDTNATKVDSVVRMIEGTARNMGLVVVD